MIKLQVIGHLGRDCVTNTVNGKSVMNFTVAHTEKYRDAQNQPKERTIWVDCAYWSDRTAIAPYLRKGTQVFVEGNPDVRTYPKNDGTTGASLTLRVMNIQLLGSRTEGGAPGQPQGAESFAQQGPANAPAAMGPIGGSDMADDLPF